METPKISFFARLLALLAPPRCVVCGSRLTVGEDIMCARCNLRLPRTHFETSPYDNIMARSFWGRFKIEKCAAWFYYSSHSDMSHLILQMKYYNHPEYGVRIGQMMAGELLTAGFFDGITGIMPLPLAHNRERHRGYNQSLEIVRGLCGVLQLPMIDNAVGRARFADSQTHKNILERNENVAGVFSLRDASRLSGQHVLLVDDIVTTGATITACAREMQKAGNVRISVLAAGFAGG